VSPVVYSAAETEQVAANTVELLQQTRPWVRFMSVLGFLCVGLMFLICVASGLTRGGFGFGPSELVLFVVFGVMYIFPSLFLSRYASRITDLAETRRVSDLDAALDAQKSFWKFVGVVAAIFTVIYALIFLFAIAGGIMAVNRMR
jgi:hypothetical protein